jgi:hypothetical protein
MPLDQTGAALRHICFEQDTEKDFVVEPLLGNCDLFLIVTWHSKISFKKPFRFEQDTSHLNL